MYCNGCTVPGFTRIAHPRWSEGKDNFLVIRRSQVRAPPVTSFELYVRVLSLIALVKLVTPT